ncbi:MAG: hypothetical protein IJV16_06605 [Lachnospiraceae bacterium]|nr:hypothetical protein [Lachnospiraceae bacterium]MBR1523096.1 hypothetical protein [Lachnospiraceae bacterium]
MKQKKYIPYIFAIICTLVYLSLVFNNNVWLDEAFSASIIRCDFGEMISRTFADTLPPFYNFSAWLFTHIFGFSTVTLKIFSVIPMLLLMLVSARFLPEVSSVQTACIYIVLMTAMPHLLEHGVEIRMYSWAVFFASATAVFAVCVIKELPHTKPWLILVTVLGAYTHQYALIAEAFVWLMLLVIFLWKKNVTGWLKMALICIVLYIPCAILTVRQMKAATTYFSASPATFDSLMASIRYPFVTNITVLSAILMISTVSLFVYACIRKEFISAYYISIYVLAAILSFCLMWITDSTFFTSRYLMPSIGILWLGLALALDEVFSESRILKAAAVLIVSAVLILVYIRQFQAEYVDMSAFEDFISTTGADDGYVIYEDFPEIEICLGYYAPWLKKYEPEDISSARGSKYLFINGDSDTDNTKKIKNFDLRYIENLSFDRYTFKAYELTE